MKTELASPIPITDPILLASETPQIRGGGRGKPTNKQTDVMADASKNGICDKQRRAASIPKCV